MVDLRDSGMLGQPCGHGLAVGVDRLHPLGIAIEIGKQDFGIGNVERRDVCRVGLQRDAHGVSQRRIGANGGHPRHHVALAGNPFGQAAGDHIGIAQGIDVQWPRHRIIQNQWRAAVLTGLGNAMEVDGAQQRIAGNLAKDGGEFPLANPHQGFVKGFTNGLIEIDHALPEQFLNLQAIDVRKL